MNVRLISTSGSMRCVLDQQRGDPEGIDNALAHEGPDQLVSLVQPIAVEREGEIAQQRIDFRGSLGVRGFH